MNTVSLVGYLAELFGFGCTAIGLYQTWKANAQGRPFFSPRLRRAGTWFLTKVLRRRPRTRVLALGIASSEEVSGYMTASKSRPLTVRMSTNERFAALVQEIGYVREEIREVHRHISNLDSQRRQDFKALREEISQVQTTLNQQDHDFAANGIPLATFGVALAAVGLALQAIGSAMPSWGS